LYGVKWDPRKFALSEKKSNGLEKFGPVIVHLSGRQARDITTYRAPHGNCIDLFVVIVPPVHVCSGKFFLFFLEAIVSFEGSRNAAAVEAQKLRNRGLEPGLNVQREHTEKHVWDAMVEQREGKSVSERNACTKKTL